jgi:hypothetical protein
MSTYSIQLPTGEFLEMLPGTQLGFELQSSIFSNTDTSVLPGSFTFPVDIPASAANRIALGFPENVHTPGTPAPIGGVWVHAAGQAMFYGTLAIRSANARRISISIVANPIASIKDVAINELDLGADVPFNTPPIDPQAFMKATAEAPLDFSFAFLPFQNLAFRPGDRPGTFLSNFIKPQNNWDVGAGGFEIDPDVPVMPMVRLDHVLRQLIETSAEGWSLVNGLQATDEMKLLYLWNNYDLWEAGNGDTDKALAASFNLRNHVSSTKGNDFLKKVSSLFCTGVFVNPFNRTVRLLPLQEVLAAPARHDWTAHAVAGPDIGFEDNERIDAFHHITDYLGPIGISPTLTELKPSTYNLSDTLEGITTFQNTGDLNAALPADGIYYVEDIAALVVRRTDGGGFHYNTTIGYQKRVARLGPGSTAYVPGFQVPFRYGSTVRWDAPGNMVVEDDANEHTWRRTGGGMDDVLFFYRGIQPDENGDNMPYCTDSDFPPDYSPAPGQLWPAGSASDDVQHSLRWTGDRGLYAKRFSHWNELVANGKTVTMQLTLPVPELVGFSFEDKVRIGQMDYFVQRLRITKLGPDRRFLVEARLFSVI